MAKEVLIFDCDGVLVDSETLMVELQAKLLSEAGFRLTADEIVERFVGRTYPDMLTEIGLQFGRTVGESLANEIRQATMAKLEADLQPLTGMPELLAGLDGPRCVASSSDLGRIHMSLVTTGLDCYFDRGAVFSAQMVPHPKPAPDLFLHAAAALEVAPDRCLVIEDSPHGVEAAIAAGMTAVGLTAAGHARPSLTGRLLGAGATDVFDAVEQLGRSLR
ncbi:MAG: HAD family hydrolase [Acidobacteriota bacterium]|nr:HAD family hydrolase [Acidobacteriota bacterium]